MIFGADGIAPGGRHGWGGAPRGPRLSPPPSRPRLIEAARADVNVPADTATFRLQFEYSTWWRRRKGSLANTARAIRGSLSAAPIHTCTNTCSSA